MTAAPHPTLSDAGMVGGGTIPTPGEISLAHHGVKCRSNQQSELLRSGLPSRSAAAYREQQEDFSLPREMEMTKHEWLTCVDPVPMLDWIQDRTSRRKLRLFGCACCRRIWPCLIHEWSRAAVETAERYADGLATEMELGRAQVHAQLAWKRARDPDNPEYQENNPFRTTTMMPCDYLAAADAAAGIAERAMMGEETLQAVCNQVRQVAVEARRGSTNGEGHQERLEQALLLRDVFAYLPSRSLADHSDWLTPTVVSLASGIYEERAFDRLPILADALEEDGCLNQDMLLHLRTPGPHVLGCWPVDLILGKS